jgi:hypothetical protein
MSDPVGAPELHRQPLAVDYIDNHAPRLHPAFAQRGSQYDPEVGRYILTSPPMAGSDNALQHPITREASSKPPCMAIGPAPAQAMGFWDEVFPEAMRRLTKNTEEHKDREIDGYSIRSLTGWDHVYQVLERCHQEYVDDTSWTKKVKKGWRTFSDNAAVPGQNALKLVPDIYFLTPVRGTIDILFDVS